MYTTDNFFLTILFFITARECRKSFIETSNNSEFNFVNVSFKSKMFCC